MRRGRPIGGLPTAVATCREESAREAIGLLRGDAAEGGMVPIRIGGDGRNRGASKAAASSQRSPELTQPSHAQPGGWWPPLLRETQEFPHALPFLQVLQPDHAVDDRRGEPHAQDDDNMAFTHASWRSPEWTFFRQNAERKHLREEVLRRRAVAKVTGTT